MAVLALDYRCCNRKLPLYIKHSEVEQIATTVRRQLVADSIDAVSFDALRQISSLKINNIDFALEISTDYPVHDERGNHVFGICEFDPASPNAAMVSISPVGENLSELLALSTLAHELGHAVFDAPGWIVQGNKGPGLFDDIEPAMQRAYRTTTPDSEHLAKSLSAKPTTEEHFAELRANEFMGSLLVPRQRIIAAVEDLAPRHDITIHRHFSTDPDHPGTALRITADGDAGAFDMECFEKALATRFGVNRRFIQVRLNRYGLTGQEASMR
ncbi:MAG: ImmA/IrrE family metallo-endopeptidase [Azoarcus sp.]|jgi:hypothetical protein|nr:ImmA/IrrE family metallo-endopeptidase [Azoarcus sp.]